MKDHDIVNTPFRRRDTSTSLVESRIDRSDTVKVNLHVGAALRWVGGRRILLQKQSSSASVSLCPVCRPASPGSDPEIVMVRVLRTVAGIGRGKSVPLTTVPLTTAINGDCRDMLRRIKGFALKVLDRVDGLLVESGEKIATGNHYPNRIDLN
ncbi:hypothetical protein VTN77DRAFT_4038 [Rasamsonia byssochlamydoides]|uniref:uncharacterized protein n=1 Tax=Rasamsonia byssochlamydoides TaxID=89139 RepID=UPI003741FE73